MRPILRLAGFGASLLALSLANPLAAQEATKIGYVDMKRLVDMAPQIQEGKNKLDREFRTINDEVLEDEEELTELEDRLARDRAVMSDPEVANLERQIRTLRRDVRRKKEDLREEFTFRLTQELQEVEEEINDAVRALAREQGFDLLLRSPVVYASERIDITDEVLSQLQQDFERQQAAQN